MPRLARIILLFFASAVLSDGLAQKNENGEHNIDAIYGQTPVSESQLKAVNKRDSSTNFESDSDYLAHDDRPFFTTQEELPNEKSTREKSTKHLSDSALSSDSTDSYTASEESERSDRSYFSSSKSSESLSGSSSSDSLSDFLSSSSSSSPKRQRSLAATVDKITYQRPWCPGQAMAAIVPIAKEPIYQWLESKGTCEEFAKRFGNLYIIVSNPENASLGCEYTPDGQPAPYSEYTTLRALALNEPIYASTYDDTRSTYFAVAAGVLFERNGIVLLISISKPVNDLPQIC